MKMLGCLLICFAVLTCTAGCLPIGIRGTSITQAERAPRAANAPGSVSQDDHAVVALRPTSPGD
jgi:hypothetical protein